MSRRGLKLSRAHRAGGILALLFGLTFASPSEALAGMSFRDDVSSSDRAFLHGPIAYERIVAERIDKPGDSSDELLRGLIALHQESHGPLLIRLLQSTNSRTKSLAVKGLSELAEMFPRAPFRGQAAAGLRPLLNEKDGGLRIAAIQAIGLTGGADDVPILLSKAEKSFAEHADDDGSTDTEPATLFEALGRLRDARALPLLRKIVTDPRQAYGARYAAGAAALALARMGDRSVLAELQKRLERRETRVLLERRGRRSASAIPSARARSRSERPDEEKTPRTIGEVVTRLPRLVVQSVHSKPSNMTDDEYIELHTRMPTWKATARADAIGINREPPRGTSSTWGIPKGKAAPPPPPVAEPAAEPGVKVRVEHMSDLLDS